MRHIGCTSTSRATGDTVIFTGPPPMRYKHLASHRSAMRNAAIDAVHDATFTHQPRSYRETMSDASRHLQHLEREISDLRQTVEELAFLNGLAEQIGGVQSSAEIIQIIVHRSVRRLKAEQGVISLLEKEQADPLKTLVRSVNNSAPQSPYHVQQALLGWMLTALQPLRIDDPRSDPRFTGVVWDEQLRSLLAVPLLVKGRLIGSLALYNKKDGPFNDDDQRLLAIVGMQSAQVIENARLSEEEASFAALEAEMRVAAGIQRSLMPATAPVVDSYDIGGVYVPARIIGGDYFDYIPLDDGRWAIAIGDVSGKGVPAALFMSVCRTLLRASMAANSDPAACLRAFNDTLCIEEHGSLFITMLLGVLDPAGHTFTYASGGHDSPLLLPADGCATLLPKPDGMLLGVFPHVEFAKHTVQFAPGDALICYTDGVTETVGSGQRMFGVEGMMDALPPLRPHGTRALLDALTSRIDTFADPISSRDDLTAVAIQRV